MHANRLRLVDHIAITGCAAIRRSDSDVICFYAEKIEAFLYGNADGAAATPEPNQKVGVKPGLRDVSGKLKGVFQEIIRCDDLLVHCFCEPQVL